MSTKATYVRPTWSFQSILQRLSEVSNNLEFVRVRVAELELNDALNNTVTAEQNEALAELHEYLCDLVLEVKECIII